MLFYRLPIMHPVRCALFFTALTALSLFGESRPLFEQDSEFLFRQSDFGGRGEALVLGRVNALSGNLLIKETDLKVAGCEPLYLQRFYNSSLTAQQMAGWLFFPHLLLELNNLDNTVYVQSRDAVTLTFHSPLPLYKLKRPSLYSHSFLLRKQEKNFQTALASDPYNSLEKRDDPQKSLLFREPDRIHYTLKNSNGSILTYRLIPPTTLKPAVSHYLLECEQLSNGHCILYSYNPSSNQLEEVRATSPDHSKTYSWIRFSYSSSDTETFCTATTSNNQSLRCKYQNLPSKKSLSRLLLQQLFLGEKKSEEFFYKFDNRWESSLLAKRTLADNQEELFSYYEGDSFKNPPRPLVEKRKAFYEDLRESYSYDPFCGRIKTLTTPSGSYSFSYHRDPLSPDGNYTDLLDADNRLTRYRFSPSLHLTAVERYSGASTDSLLRKELFTWGQGLFSSKLLNKTEVDSQNRLVQASYFSYDAKGNLVAEKRVGNFSADAESSDLSSLDSVTTIYRYSSDERSLLLCKERANGQTLLYSYLPQCDLLSSLFLCNRNTIATRTFYTYSPDNVLIEQIQDNGSSPEPSDWQGVTQRTIRRIHLREQEPFFHLPASEEELYYDLATDQEILLKRTLFHYAPSGEIIQRDLYDSKGELRYSLFSEYDSNGNLLFETNPLGQKTEPSSPIKQQEIPFAKKVSCNLLGNPTHIIYQDGTEESKRYYAHGPLKLFIDKEGNQERYEYDYQDRLTTKKLYDPSGNLLSEETFSYDAFHLRSHTDPCGKKTLYTYDGAGRKATEQSGDLQVEFSYDSLGRCSSSKQSCDGHSLFTKRSYDLLDRIIEESCSDENGILYNRRTLSYNDNGLIESICQTIDGKESKELFFYDSQGALLQRISPLGEIFYTTQEAKSGSSGQFVKTTLFPNGARNESLHDLQNHLLSSKTFDPQGALLVEHLYTYDAEGTLLNQKILTSQGTEEKSWEYDSMGRVITFTTETLPDKKRSYSCSYTPKGALRSLTQPNGATLFYTYNPLGHLTEISSSDNTIHYQFQRDPLGKILSSTDLLTKKSLYRSYDNSGNLIEERLSNGLALRYRYDARNRKTAAYFPDNSYALYDYDAAALRKATRYSPSHQVLYSHSYTEYDTSGHALSEALVGSLGSLRYRLDAAGKPLSIEAAPFYRATLSYDTAGNPILYQSRSPFFEQQSHYRYNALSELVEEGGTFTLPSPTQQPSLRYDPNGNILQIDSLQLCYDALNRLISAQKPKEFLILYEYDSFNRKTAQNSYTWKESDWSLEKRDTFLYEEEKEIGRIGADGRTVEFRLLPPTKEKAVCIELGSLFYAPIHDPWGNTATLISLKAHKPIASYFYNRQGTEKTLQNSPAFNPWRYAGERSEELTEFVYLSGRHYSPKLGRYLSSFPLTPLKEPLSPADRSLHQH